MRLYCLEAFILFNSFYRISCGILSDQNHDLQIGVARCHGFLIPVYEPFPHCLIVAVSGSLKPSEKEKSFYILLSKCIKGCASPSGRVF